LHLTAEGLQAIEALVGSSARRALRVSRAFGGYALRYSIQRLPSVPTRIALASVVHGAKRNQSFEGCRFVGLALEGTTAGRRLVAQDQSQHAFGQAGEVEVFALQKTREPLVAALELGSVRKGASHRGQMQTP